MTTEEYPIYDFRQAGSADDSAGAFRTWIAKAAQAFGDHWVNLSDSEASLTTTESRTQSLDAVASQIAPTNVCCTFHLVEDSLSIWHLTQEDAHSLVAELLRLPDDATPPERALTAIENALLETFFEVLARSISNGWLGPSPINCVMKELSVNPKRVRLCRGKDLISASSLNVELPRGKIAIHWISKKQEMADLLKQVSERRATTKQQVDPHGIVETLPIEIVGLLGKTNISMRKLANISVGDIVPLNQKIDHPITASIDGKPFFQCWPGKIGDTIGLEISECLGAPAAPASAS
jgi:flagellar motor switch/type III secretory pathway protein FliN